jgi:hypothetical protein
MKGLHWIEGNVRPGKILKLAKQGIIHEQSADQFQPHLKRMGLAEPSSLKEKLYRQLVLTGLFATAE